MLYLSTSFGFAAYFICNLCSFPVIDFTLQLSGRTGPVNPGKSFNILMCLFPLLESPGRRGVLFPSPRKYLENCDE